MTMTSDHLLQWPNRNFSSRQGRLELKEEKDGREEEANKWLDWMPSDISCKLVWLGLVGSTQLKQALVGPTKSQAESLREAC